jgi:hypothetical protein
VTARGQDLWFGFGASFRGFEFDLILARHTGRATGNGSRFDTRDSTQGLKNPVGTLLGGSSVVGFGPRIANVKRENMPRIEARRYAPEFLKASKQEPSSGQQRHR